MKKLLLGLLIALLITTLAFAASAEVVSSGECGADGDNITWTLDSDGLLTISGSGEMGETNFSNRSELKSVTINAPITTLGYSMFSNCINLERVTLPSTLTTIEKFAFGGCRSLTEIALPTSLTSIGEKAFSGCSSLKSLTIPSSVKTVGSEALPSVVAEIHYSGTAAEYMGISFGGFSERVVISYSLYIGGELVEDFAVPSGTETINKHAFYGCTSLKSVNIPSSVKEISDYAFECSALESVTIAEGVETIGYRAFARCDALKEATIPESVKTVEYYAFLNENFEKLTVLSKDVEIYSEAVADNVTIVCYKDSTAYDYAIEYGLNYEIINEDGTITVPTKLATPQNLSFVDENGYVTGKVYCDGVENCYEYKVNFYSNGWLLATIERVSTYSGNRIYFDFKEAWTESDVYSFSVQAIGDGVNYSDSDVAYSEKFEFTMPTERLAAPTGHTWTEDGKITYPIIPNIPYEITFYIVTNGEYKKLSSLTKTTLQNVSSTTYELSPSITRRIEKHISDNNLESADIVYTLTALSYDMATYLDSPVSDYSPAYTYTVEKEEIVGDTDGDGVLTVADTLSSLKAMLNGEDATNADMNGDGIINLIDVLRILKATVQ